MFKKKTIFFLIALTAVLTTQIAFGKIVYVDDDATGANDGTSWENAYVYLQEALADANSSEKPVEICVAQGVYKPDQGANQTPGDRDATFQLINGVTLAGGYAGLGSPDPSARVVALYKTILSGDLNGDDVEVNDPCDLLKELSRAENSYHVVSADYCNNSAVLDGFVITNGNANSQSHQDANSVGGGIYINNSSVTITNCVLRNNAANFDGGGIFSLSGRGPSLNNCIFIHNTGGSIVKEDLTTYFYGSGGGMYNFDNSPNLTNCTFIENRSTNGGGMFNVESNPTLVNCTFGSNQVISAGGGMYNQLSDVVVTNTIFASNSANEFGGGMFNIMGKLTLTNCTFCRNSADFTGGGIRSLGGDSIKLTNCTFAQNSAPEGNALDSWTVLPNNIEFIDCILWDGGDEIRYDVNYSTITVAYSDIYGGWEGVGNIDVDPFFADPNNGDYHLKSQVGKWDPNDGWIKNDVTSPCIDAGDPNSDWTGETWPHGERINMGAYGGTREASMSTQTDGMSLPRVVYFHYHDILAMIGFKSLLEMYGVSVTSVSVFNYEQVLLTDYDLIIVGDDITGAQALEDVRFISAVEDSGKPVIGLGDGGYDFFGELDLSIGNPYGGHGSKNGIRVVNSEYSLFSTPYQIEIPDDQKLQLYTETNSVGIYLWPGIPETVTVIGSEPDDAGYYPLLMEHNRYLLWGFTESPQKMTEIGKRLFINVVIWTANAGWEREN